MIDLIDISQTIINKYFIYVFFFFSCVTCKSCFQIICRKPSCSDWIPNRGESEWECKNCNKDRKVHKKAGEWLLQQISQNFFATETIDQTILLNVDENNEYEFNQISLSQKERIREFLEELLGTMLGGSLDEISVGPIRKSKDCKY